MERRILLFKTAETCLEKDVLQDLDSKYINCIQTCSLGPPSKSLLSVEDLYSCCVPDSWVKVSSKDDILNKIVDNQTYTVKDMSVLSERLHELLDSISSPGSALLNIVWVCDRLPEVPPPSLYGALERAVSWHGGHITALLTSNTAQYPDWVQDLRIEALPLCYLCPCHGLEEFLTPALVWRGGLAVLSPGDLSSSVIQGYELHFERDDLDLVLQKINLTKPDTVVEKQPDLTKKYYGCSLELVSEVDPLSVPPTMLTDKRFILKTPLLEDDDLTEFFMSEGFPSTRVGYIARLRVSDTLAKRVKARSWENWRREVVEGSQGDLDDSYLGERSLDALYFLLHSDGTPSTECVRSTLQKYAILLKNPATVAERHNPGRARVAQYSGVLWDVVDSVNCIDVTATVPIHVLHAGRRNIVAKVLKSLLDDKSELVHSMSTDDLVLAVEEAIKDIWSIVEENITLSTNPVDIDAHITAAKAKLTFKYSDDSVEKRMLKADQLLLKRQENLTSERELNILSRRVDTISLEAKEILKFFKSTGEPADNLVLEPVAIGKRNPAQLSEEQYRKIFNENFELVTPHTEYCGFRFKGEDFNVMEFTQYHDVYYNNGPTAEFNDKEFRRLRDVYVGISKETSTTLDLDKAPEKLKLKSRNPEGVATEASSLRATDLSSLRTTDLSSLRSTDPTSIRSTEVPSRRSSPRKKLGKVWTSPRKSVTGVGRSGQKADSQQGRSGLKADRQQGRTVGRRSGRTGSTVSEPPEASEERRKKKLRVAVYQALLEKGVKEQDPLFRPCFSTLFKMCQIIGVTHSGEKTSELMLDVARSNVDNVINVERIKNKKRK